MIVLICSLHLNLNFTFLSVLKCLLIKSNMVYVAVLKSLEEDHIFSRSIQGKNLVSFNNAYVLHLHQLQPEHVLS